MLCNIELTYVNINIKLTLVLFILKHCVQLQIETPSVLIRIRSKYLVMSFFGFLSIIQARDIKFHMKVSHADKVNFKC